MARPFDPNKPARDSEILRRHLAGEPKKVIKGHFGISEATFKRAIEAAKAHPASAFPDVVLEPISTERSKIDLSTGSTIRILRDMHADRAELARLIPMTTSRLVIIEEGKTSMTIAELEKIAHVFGLKAHELLDARDPRLHTIKPIIRIQAEKSIKEKLNDLRKRESVLELRQLQE